MPGSCEHIPPMTDRSSRQWGDEQLYTGACSPEFVWCALSGHWGTRGVAWKRGSLMHQTPHKRPATPGGELRPPIGDNVLWDSIEVENVLHKQLPSLCSCGKHGQL